MASAVTDHFDGADRACFERLARFRSTPGDEAPLQAWFRDHLEDLGFETVTWTADADALARHPSFPDDPAAIAVADRPSVAGVLELGDPDAGRTLVLNGHCDVVPVDEAAWSSDPFEPTWDGDTVTARGATDMLAGLTACVYAAAYVHETATDLDGRLVVESVVGEEEGGIGAAAAAGANPYPFERDAAVIAEPTDLHAVTATEGSLMKRLRLRGRSAHAATRWRGESVLPHFFRIHEALLALERERARTVSHPLYGAYDNPWPINVGTVSAGDWASSVPAELTAEVRIGVAPGETVAGVEAVVDDRVDALAADDAWLREHPPRFERFSVQFEPAEVDATAAIVEAVRASLRADGLDDAPTGVTYGTDARHYLAAGIPTVVCGPGSIDQAHAPDESIAWPRVERGADVLAETARRFLAG